MKRPHPIRRIVDGPPDASGKAIVRRTVALLVPAICFSNTVGALVVFSLAYWALPLPDLDNAETVRLWNFALAGAYVIASVFIGSFLGLAKGRPIRSWLAEGRTPTEDEQRATLRLPWRLLRLNAFMWLVGAVVFATLNLVWSAELAAEVFLTVLFGGLTTSAATFLITERISRPMAARTLSYGVPERPVLPGITTRSLFAWALGVGIPVLGLTMIAVVSLVDEGVTDTELALTILGLGGTALGVGLLMTYQTARSVSDPVLSVRDGLAEIELGHLDTEIPVYDGSELGLLQAGFNRMAAGLREREKVRDLFGRHVGQDVAQAALERDIELGGEGREVAVLFIDLVGSTKLAAERPPEEVVEALNEFFGIVVEVVERHGGWVNKFEGDAALAVFGAPIERDDSATGALASARRLASRLAAELPGLEAGIGVSAGRAVAGNVGSEQRFEYTVIGDPVNEAARLCELSKEVAGMVLASGSALERADDDEQVLWELGESKLLRGRAAETRLAVPKRL